MAQNWMADDSTSISDDQPPRAIRDELPPGVRVVRFALDTFGFLHTLLFTSEGHRYLCEVDAGPVSAAGPAPVRRARWRVSIDGADQGPWFEATPDDAPFLVAAHVLACAGTRPPVQAARSTTHTA